MKTFSWALAAFILLSDRLSKILVSSYLQPGEYITTPGDFFRIALVHNTGAAFGILKGHTSVFAIISAIAVFSITLFLIYEHNRLFLRDTGLSLILGGVLGNLFDRLRFGYVIDFLDFRVWPVFNIADSAITIGVFLIALEYLRVNIKGNKNVSCII